MRTRLPAVLAAALLMVSAVPASATPVTLSQGHVDAFWIEYTGGQLKSWVNDDSVSPPVKRSPADVVLHAGPESETTVVAPANPPCLGTPGNPVWLLPQIQDPDLLWLGWDSNALSTGTFVDNKVTLKLHSVSGPGNFCVFSRSIGATTLLYSGDGLPDTVSVPVDQHRHVNWAFTASGTYTATFEISGTLALGGGTRSTGLLPYSFLVR